ncbi:MAG: hypothetical protein JNL39_00180 [Opitutaceae bacterium]|nr:hypothetical protein [Opitutaceae bacterium]
MKTTRRQFITQAGSAVAVAAIAGGPGLRAAVAPAADELCFKSARELLRLLGERKVSARELMSAHLAQIARVNPKINAIVAKLDDAECLALAERADRQLARRERVGPLHGLPFAHKDTEPAVGFPFTSGTPIFRTRMPTADSAAVERIRAAGALSIGKTNVPEFAMGSHTYNPVYGPTRNPYDLTKSAGGSSGGAGAALATGMLPLANGSDLGGSLRNPGNFNNVVGYRPTAGLVSLAPTATPFGTMVTKGPLARSVADAALLLSVMAGADDRDPGGYPSDPAQFLRPLERDLKGVRVAWCPDLGGLPLDPRVRAVLAAQRATFERMGCIVEDAAPNLDGADEAFLTLRAWRTFHNLGPLLAQHRAVMKPEAIGEIEAGAKVTATQIARSLEVQAQVIQRMIAFQRTYEFVLCAVNQVPPFDVTLAWPKEIAGVKMVGYTDWMKSAYRITVTSCPAVSVPAGFTPEGLPVGIQIVGRYRGDFELLRVAHMFEQATRVGATRPAIAG